MKIRVILAMVACSFIISTPGFGQQSTVAAEGNATGFTGSVSYSVGQALYTVQSAETGNITQGVQQPFDVVIVSTSDIGDAISTLVFPNPASDAIHLNIDPARSGSYDLHELSYTITDMNGRHLMYEQVQEAETIIPVNHLSEAIYFLNIQYRHENIKTYKIAKTNE